MHVGAAEVTTKNIIESIPRQRDLADGPESPMGGRLAGHLTSYSDTEFEALVAKGEALLDEIRGDTADS
jgi:hypothetical protein